MRSKVQTVMITQEKLTLGSKEFNAQVVKVMLYGGV